MMRWLNYWRLRERTVVEKGKFITVEYYQKRSGHTVVTRVMR